MCQYQFELSRVSSSANSIYIAVSRKPYDELTFSKKNKKKNAEKKKTVQLRYKSQTLLSKCVCVSNTESIHIKRIKLNTCALICIKAVMLTSAIENSIFELKDNAIPLNVVAFEIPYFVCVCVCMIVIFGERKTPG